jgi:hypothetical protein
MIDECPVETMSSSVRLATILLVCPAFAGCNEGYHVALPSVARIASEPLFDELSRSHHFGAVISEPGRKLKYNHVLRNKSRHAIRIVDLVNRKPCCGEIHLGKNTLEPGEETAVEVTLFVNQEFGEIVHDTVVVTEPRQTDELVLRTMAKAYPPIRFEQTTPESPSALVSSERPRKVDLTVFAYGTSPQPGVDLTASRWNLRSKPRGSVPRSKTARTAI